VLYRRKMNLGGVGLGNERAEPVKVEILKRGKVSED
jgi:hypothetical protein